MNMFELKKKIHCLFCSIGLVRCEEGSRSEAPILKPRPWRVTEPPETVDFNEFHRNIRKQLTIRYNDNRTKK